MQCILNGQCGYCVVCTPLHHPLGLPSNGVEGWNLHSHAQACHTAKVALLGLSNDFSLKAFLPMKEQDDRSGTLAHSVMVCIRQSPL